MPLNAPIVDGFAGSAPTLGAAWTALLGTCSKNEVAIPGVVPNILVYNTPSPTDCETYLTVPTKPALSGYIAVYSRTQYETVGTFRGYGVQVISGAVSDTWNLISVTGALPTTLVTVSRSFLAGDKIGIRCIGDTIQAWHFAGGVWSKVLEATNPLYPNAGKPGFTLSDVVGRIDDFASGSLTPDPLPPAVQRRSSILNLRRLLWL